MNRGVRMRVLAATLATTLMATSDSAQRKSAFGPGEQSTYKVEHRGVSVGTIQMTVGAPTSRWERSVLPIVALAQTSGIFELYRIRDKYVSYWDHGQEQCIGTDLYADENREQRQQRTQFDHSAGKATVVKQVGGAAPTTSSFDVEPGAFDIVAAIFALRNRPLAVGATVELPVFTGRKMFTLRATVDGKETLETDAGPRETFKLRVQTGFTGRLVSKKDLTAWLTADQTHVPVRIEAEFVLGTIRAELTNYAGGRPYTLSGSPH